MKTSTASTPYGYQELRQSYQRYMSFSISLTVSFFITCLIGYQVLYSPRVNFPGDKKNDTIKIDLTRWQPPLDPVQRSGFRPFVNPKLGFGFPIPMPNTIVDSSMEFASQKQLSDAANKSFTQFDDEVDNGSISIPSNQSALSPKEIWEVQKEPVAVMNPKPEYPDIALKVGMEGFVTVKVLIDTEGKVKKSVLVKSSESIFAQPSLDAAQQWVFTPALMNGRPVQVWVSIPFRFRLTGR